MTDDLDFDAPPRGRIGGPRPRRGRGSTSRAKHGLLIMVPPSVRRAAREKLSLIHGVNLSPQCGIASIARAIAKALALPLPDDFGASTRLVTGFVGKPLADPVPPPAERPFVPLRVSPEMERALARTRAAREVGTPSSGSSIRPRTVPE